MSSLKERIEQSMDALRYRLTWECALSRKESRELLELLAELAKDKDAPQMPLTLSRNRLFVMLRHQKGFPMPMVEGEEELVKLFLTRKEAVDAAKRNPFGETFGYEIYEW
jgi:hypothetical protein